MKRAADFLPSLEALAVKRSAWRESQIAAHGWASDVSCAACGDTGIMPILGASPGHLRQVDVPCMTCERGREITECRRRAAVWVDECPRRFRDYTLDSHPRTGAVALVRAWREHDYAAGKNVVLFSDGPGTGKTGLAIALIREFSLDGTGVKFGTVPDLLEELRPRYDKDNGPASSLTTMQRVPLLVMDDMGTEKVTEWVAERLYLILNGRYENGLPTIATTNRHIETLHEVVGARVVSRLIESALSINMSGRDLRRTDSTAIPSPTAKGDLKARIRTPAHEKGPR